MMQKKEKKSAKLKDLSQLINSEILISAKLKHCPPSLSDALCEIGKIRKVRVVDTFEQNEAYDKSFVLITDDPLEFKNFAQKNGKSIFYGNYRSSESYSVFLKLDPDMDKEYYINKIKTFIHKK